MNNPPKYPALLAFVALMLLFGTGYFPAFVLPFDWASTQSKYVLLDLVLAVGGGAVLGGLVFSGGRFFARGGVLRGVILNVSMFACVLLYFHSVCDWRKHFGVWDASPPFCVALLLTLGVQRLFLTGD